MIVASVHVYIVVCHSQLNFLCIISLKLHNFMQQKMWQAASPFYREGLGEEESLSPTSQKPNVNATVQTKPSNSKFTILSVLEQQIQTLLCSFYTLLNNNILGLERSLTITEIWNPKTLNNMLKITHRVGTRSLVFIVPPGQSFQSTSI